MIQSIFFFYISVLIPSLRVLLYNNRPRMENTLPHKRRRTSFQGIACIPSAVLGSDLQFGTKAAGDQGSTQPLPLRGRCAESPHGPHVGSGFIPHPAGARPGEEQAGPQPGRCQRVVISIATQQASRGPPGRQQEGVLIVSVRPHTPLPAH